MLKLMKLPTFWNVTVNLGLFILAVTMIFLNHPDNLWKVMAAIETVVLIHIVVQHLETKSETEQQGVHHEY